MGPRPIRTHAPFLAARLRVTVPIGPGSWPWVGPDWSIPDWSRDQKGPNGPLDKTLATRYSGRRRRILRKGMGGV